MGTRATPEVNVCTIEAPMEMTEPLFNQMQVQPIIGVDFASGVRTLLRQDPDIIMVGEVRDRDTADMAGGGAPPPGPGRAPRRNPNAPPPVARRPELPRAPRPPPPA